MHIAGAINMVGHQIEGVLVPNHPTPLVGGGEHLDDVSCADVHHEERLQSSGVNPLPQQVLHNEVVNAAGLKRPIPVRWSV